MTCGIKEISILLIVIVIVGGSIEVSLLLYFEDAITQCFNYVEQLPFPTRKALRIVLSICGLAVLTGASLIGLELKIKGKLLFITIFSATSLLILRLGDTFSANMHHSSYKTSAFGIIPILLVIAFLFTFFKSFLVCKVLKKYQKN
jgi:hypothetical protein